MAVEFLLSVVSVKGVLQQGLKGEKIVAEQSL
jgi:hypothetical protein